MPKEVVKERFSKLLKEIQTISAQITEQHMGETVEVMVEEINAQNDELVTGRLSNNAVVHFPGNRSMIGQLCDVRLTESKGFYYMGERV